MLTLSLGIAVNMLVFTLINGALLRDLPFAEPDRIVEIRVFHRDRPQEPTTGASYLDVRDWRGAVSAFDGHRRRRRADDERLGRSARGRAL